MREAFHPLPQQQRIIQTMLSDHEKLIWSKAGSGKTAAVLYMLTVLHQNLAFEGALIVAPRLSIDKTWPDEIKRWKFAEWIKVADLRTPEGVEAWETGSADVYLINYDRLNLLKKLTSKNASARIAILDEVTCLKNPQSGRSVLWNGRFRKDTKNTSIRKTFNRVYGLTGTPYGNHLSDLFGQALAVDAGKRLGRFFTNFTSLHFDLSYNGFTLKPKEGAKERILGQLGNLVLSIENPVDVGVSPIVYKNYEVELTQEVRAIYRKAQRDFLFEFKKTTITAANAAVLVGKLLQLTSGCLYTQKGLLSNLRTFEHLEIVVHHLKIDALRKIAEQGENLLVFVTFIAEKRRLLEAFPGAEILSKDNIDRWNSGKIPMLIAHPKSAGYSLNLQDGGKRIVWFTLCHSALLYSQANSRLQRKGQMYEVHVTHLICPGTIDVVVLNALNAKNKEEGSLLKIVQNLQQLPI